MTDWLHLLEVYLEVALIQPQNEHIEIQSLWLDVEVCHIRNQRCSQKPAGNDFIMSVVARVHQTVQVAGTGRLLVTFCDRGSHETYPCRALATASANLNTFALTS